MNAPSSFQQSLQQARHAYETAPTGARLSLFAGGILTLVGLGQRSLLMTAAGGYLLYRGMSRCCGAPHYPDESRVAQRIAQGPSLRDIDYPRTEDLVEEASVESFPASDAPSWTARR